MGITSIIIQFEHYLLKSTASSDQNPDFPPGYLLRKVIFSWNWYFITFISVDLNDPSWKMISSRNERKAKVELALIELWKNSNDPNIFRISPDQRSESERSASLTTDSTTELKSHFLMDPKLMILSNEF